MGVMELPGQHKSIIYIEKGGCWVCLNYTRNPRYPYPRIQHEGHQLLLHRFIYSICKNIPISLLDGLVIMHSCDNPECVNPNHLVLGTQLENINDMLMKDRQQHGETNGMSKLSLRNVKFIRKSRLKGIELARLFSVHPSCISRIRNNKRWKESMKDDISKATVL